MELRKLICITYYCLFQCGQLGELGEECFLMSFRVSDEMTEHVGSVKGDHFCLLRPELVTDFSNFCQGKLSFGYNKSTVTF